MDLHLKGKVVLITGGSKGIGLACAHAFAAEGARVSISSRSAANLAAAAAQLRAAGFNVDTQVADLTDAAQAQGAVRAAEAALGPIDILINSAGAAKRTVPEDLNPEAWAAAMNAKYFTYIHAMDAALKGMVARQAGVIVNIVGNGGKVANAIHIPGGAANAALMLATVGLATAWGRKGIRINAINPGGTLTGRVAQALEAEAKLTGKTPDELRKAGEERLPLGRYARPEEIADAALFLASARASYVTGAILTMDGGQTPTVV